MSATSPRQQSSATIRAEISQRTIALLNLPDTVNDARVRALAEPYGALRKIVLRPDHRGAILEFQDVNDAGKAAMALDGHEIDPDRRIAIGNVRELLGQKAEVRNETPVGTKQNGTGTTSLLPPGHIRRPGRKEGRRGGLGTKRGGGVDAGQRLSESEGGKSNADFKAMLLQGR